MSRCCVVQVISLTEIQLLPVCSCKRETNRDESCMRVWVQMLFVSLWVQCSLMVAWNCFMEKFLSLDWVLKRLLPVAQLVEYTMALKVMGSIPREYTIKKSIPWMHHKSIRIKVFVKCINILWISIWVGPLVKWTEMMQSNRFKALAKKCNVISVILLKRVEWLK